MNNIDEINKNLKNIADQLENIYKLLAILVLSKPAQAEKKEEKREERKNKFPHENVIDFDGFWVNGRKTKLVPKIGDIRW